MLETTKLWPGVTMLFVAGCAVSGPVASPAPAQLAAPLDARARDDVTLGAEAAAMLAQAETDVQRARARRALWLGAWEALLAARKAIAASEPARAIEQAKKASELAQLGLEQLAYPAVK